MFDFLKALLSFGKTEKQEPVTDVYKPPRAKKSSVSSKKSAPQKTTKSSAVSKSALEKMTKKQIEDYAKKQFKVDLDRRKKKADLVEEVVKLSKESK